MTVVVDLGCADRGEWFSLPALANEYKPELIYGFDPSPLLNVRIRKAAGVPVKLERKAAWIYDGTVTFDDSWIRGRQGPIGFAPYVTHSVGRVGTIGEGEDEVPCFDFSEWLRDHPGCVVKMDIEGAEFGLLNHLFEHETAVLMSELVIEWHDAPDKRQLKELKRLGVPVRDWWM